MMEHIDTLIINRLGEHQRKIDFVSTNIAMRKRNASRFKINVIVASVAASIAIILAVSPMLFHRDSISNISISTPEFADFRGDGYETIEQLVNIGEYEKALTLVDEDLNAIEIEITDIPSTNDVPNEELECLISMYDTRKEELMWCKIYLLIKLEKKNDLKECCLNYLNNSHFEIHRKDVNEILQKIS